LDWLIKCFGEISCKFGEQTKVLNIVYRDRSSNFKLDKNDFGALSHFYFAMSSPISFTKVEKYLQYAYKIIKQAWKYDFGYPCTLISYRKNCVLMFLVIYSPCCHSWFVYPRI